MTRQDDVEFQVKAIVSFCSQLQKDQRSARCTQLLQWLKEGGMNETALADIEFEARRRLNILADG